MNATRTPLLFVKLACRAVWKIRHITPFLPTDYTSQPILLSTILHADLIRQEAGTLRPICAEDSGIRLHLDRQADANDDKLGTLLLGLE